MKRRRFEHLLVELSVAAGRVVPRYALWLKLGELGATPEQLTRKDALSFCDEHLGAFLTEHGMALAPGARRQLRRAIARFDARHPSPSEWMERIDHVAD